MCGIAGVFNLNNEPFALSNLKIMADAIAHRGPDGDGFFIDEGIALAHKRLAILDVSTKGAQPMTSKDGQWTIVFNGCIYNYLELKQELKSKGHEFISSSDTEVISEGLAAYGPEFFKRLNGMFAVGAWNHQEKMLYLSRDRYGIKPLYYWFTGKTLVFASEIKAIIAHPKFSVQLNMGALNEYFTFQNMFTFRTLFDGVEMLPPANTIKINSLSSKIKHHSWWDYDFSQPDETLSFEDAKNETERLFRNAVSTQMISDVPVGSYLSGGMDSGSITALASSHVNRLATFTCGFDMSEVTGVESNYDERRDAELMANYFKTEHYEQVLNAGDIKWSLPRVVNHLEDLRVGMSYPNYYISRLASKFVKVCLQGTGGDELFGGYPWRYYRVFKSVSQKEYFNNYYDFWQRLVPDKDKSNLFSANVFKQINLKEPREIFERVFTFNDSLRYDTPEQHINNSLYFESKTFLSGLFLVGDKLAMANGLEERFPFMDNNLVDFAQKIPIKYKLGNLEEMKRINENEFGNKRKLYQEYDDGKNVLRKAMQGFMPEKIINRKKQGFSAPDESWYRGENASYIKELLLNNKTVSSDFINRDYIKKIVDEHVNDHINHRLLIWSLMNFEWWCKIFLNNEKF
ncbi:MAG: asparagine synthase (glutamine-hydrolyzing) [Bacteroidetes bacterium]|nr:asparagine synthase (glutamine-hydrolyzing) [Bacteroidota bacterium]MBU1371232.1 asparagine synthase (glutamine-hydrolyzing) [Bacteroidota bacterium]MBU1483809.1 asparagine synthase (glutamine-hydrolyzing) [Bacteroidota bacterium]MBU1760830.1 asparagine synthase (glutamine-hydrolyzing) [Bacteroidota bacterium]MBU2266771.1 asparagine synthase (glutamine-hydrolyzing) [Bacteroidota bacterium]